MKNVLGKLRNITSAIMYAAEGIELETVLERIADVAREIAGTRYAAMGVPNGDGGLRYFKTSGMAPEEIALLEHYPQGHGLIGAIMRERKPIRLERMVDDERSVGFPENHPPMTSLLGVPIQTGGQLFGVLYLCDKINGQPFTEEDQELVEMVAAHAALAIAGAELAAQRRRVELLAERERIGMELHDGIIQSLYGLGMQVELLRMEPAVDATALEPLVDGLNDTIEDIRAYIMDLRRRQGPAMTMRDCIEQIRTRLHLPNGVQFQVDVPDEPPPFSPAVFDSICLIVNEAVSNAVRHANAQTIHLKIRRSRDQLDVVIEDDGTGFNVDDVERNTGLGLRNMQKRARMYGGQVVIDSHQNQGTRLNIQIPVRAY